MTHNRKLVRQMMVYLWNIMQPFKIIIMWQMKE